MSYFSSKINNVDRIEAMKARLNASNIIKEDHLSQSIHCRREPGFKSSILSGNLNLPLQNNHKVSDMKSRVEREMNQGIKLATDKKQLVLLIEDQNELQSKIKSDYERQISHTKNQIDLNERNIAELSRELNIRLEKISKVRDGNDQMESEFNSLSEENRALENEIKRLGEKTTSKIGDMQQKMQIVLHDFETQKDKHQQELDRLNHFSTEKIKRLEEDLTKKAELAQNRYNDMLVSKQNTEAEFYRLQDTKKRAETELDDKIRVMKQEFYEEDQAQFEGILRINQNKLRSVIENKEMLMKKQISLQKDLDVLKPELKKDERELLNYNQTLNEELNVAREDIMRIQKDIEETRNKNMNIEANLQKYHSEINKNSFSFKQISDNSKFKVKDLVEKFRGEVVAAQARLLAQQKKNKDLTNELSDAENKFNVIEKNTQRMVETMKTQLNRNIVNTISEHKDINRSNVRDVIQSSQLNHFF